MERQGKKTNRRRGNTSLVENESTRKSYNLRKRKYETEQYEQDKSMENGNIKRRCFKTDDQNTSKQHQIAARGQKVQHTKTDMSKEKQPHPGFQNKKTRLKQPLRRNIIQEIQPVGTKRLTRLSMKTDQNSKRKVSDSKLQLMQRKTQVKGERLSRIKLTNRDKNRAQRTLHRTPQSGKKRILQGTPKPMLTSKAPEKEIISKTSNTKQKAQKQSRGGVSKDSNQTKQAYIQQSNKAKHRTITKPKVIKEDSRKAARKSAKEADHSTFFPTKGMKPTTDFSTMFLEKIDACFCPEAGHMSEIHALSVANDNLIWLNRIERCVQLLNSSGEVLRTIDLDHSPVFNCCTPSGDLLETQEYAEGAKPVITLISRVGNIRVLADLSSYATNLCGILCENETIFVFGHSNKADVDGKGRDQVFIVKLDMSGEVEGVCNTEKYDNINRIISLNGQIIALRTNNSAMIPLKGEIISTEKVNGVCIDRAYSATASVDNLGNVILASNAELMIIDPSLEFVHRIDIDIGDIISTAVDKNIQLWLGTASGKLYSAQYLK